MLPLRLLPCQQPACPHPFLDSLLKLLQIHYCRQKSKLLFFHSLFRSPYSYLHSCKSFTTCIIYAYFAFCNSFWETFPFFFIHYCTFSTNFRHNIPISFILNGNCLLISMFFDINLLYSSSFNSIF